MFHSRRATDTQSAPVGHLPPPPLGCAGLAADQFEVEELAGPSASAGADVIDHELIYPQKRKGTKPVVFVVFVSQQLLEVFFYFSFSFFETSSQIENRTGGERERDGGGMFLTLFFPLSPRWLTGCPESHR